ncbi:hypothetical protein FP026_07680 [Rhizobium tropici]|uniref:Uncharacterized protein n=1 Tax=Rhizobium tropici TaxID=398 RepID=A0A5B0WAS1_RHITR|nr:hypothetical protein [Rhizobium tropici]KAA1183892.1 hypothetical protein FP026_07680 [Rhizobium tropici]
MDASRNCYLSLEDLRHTLSHVMPGIGQFWSRQLKDYARALYQVEGHRTGCVIRDDAMIRLQACVERAALRSGADRPQAREAADQLTAAPVIQTGPHCHLLIEPDAFYTHLFSLLGLNAHRLRWHIWYGASTVKFIEKAKKGPGWLDLDNEVINVFGLSRSRMDADSLCGSNGIYRFLLSGSERGVGANASAARLKAILPSKGFISAAEAIKAGNQALWARSFPGQIRLLQLDDIDVADLVADHLEDTESWLWKCLGGDAACATAILQAIDELDAGPWKGWIRRTTDLFWGLAGGRIYPLRLKDGALSNVKASRPDVMFEPMSIAAALRQRRIVPSLFMTFLVISFLPGTRVLGGCRQVVYYPLMRHVLATALGKTGKADLLNSLRADIRPGVWGHRVLKPHNGYPFAELENETVMDLLEIYGEQPLGDACGDLANFTGDPIWAGLTGRMNNGEIRVPMPEWQWARWT